MINLILSTDSYKFTHWKQYPPGTETVYSYFESRGGQFPQTVFFGLQYFLKKYLTGPVLVESHINEAQVFAKEHFAREDIFNLSGWTYLLREKNGLLPISIKAVPEGRVIPNHNVLMTIENTDPNCFWLTNHLETLLVQIWYGCTVATLSHYIKKLILGYLEETGDPNQIELKLHDFGFRGVSSLESASIGGAAHLLSFKGTDNVAGITLAQKYYNATMPGFSIPAAEHSTITAWGAENEHRAMAHILDQFPTGLVSVVSDSYDVYRACRDIWGSKLRDQVLGRDGTVVVRPDSGYPPEIVVAVLAILGEALGFTTNPKGYKVLTPKMRVIQGDGVDYEMIDKVLAHMKTHGWSADNIVFGMGGALLQKLNRDTQKFAFKCSSVTVQGQDRDVYKLPVTDEGKKSKAGRFKLVLRQGAQGKFYETVPYDNKNDELVEIFRNGTLVKEYSFDECREQTLREHKAQAL
jgi:nicotinamide phosphoribosyltransferase